MHHGCGQILAQDLWADLATAMRDGLQRGQRLRSVGKIRSGHESSTVMYKPILPVSPPTEICVTHTETGKNKRNSV
jgi:hypothetical protein